LCLPRSRLAAATARRPSTTSVASMTYHDLVVSPALGAYVGTALTTLSLRALCRAGIPVRPGCRSGVDGGVWSRRPTLTRGPGVPHANRAAYRSASPQVKMTVWSQRLSPVGTTQGLFGAAIAARCLFGATAARCLLSAATLPRRRPPAGRRSPPHPRRRVPHFRGRPGSRSARLPPGAT
jgi:hypothetical protein